MAGTISRATLAHRQYFCRLLVEAREHAGLSQRALAERLGWTRNTIARIELNERRLDVTEFLLWCDAVGVAPEAILRTLRRRRR